MKGEEKMKNKAFFSLVLSMVIFGTVGIFRRYIPLPSGFIAFSRGFIGFLFLAAFLFIKKIPLSKDILKKNFFALASSGMLMGLNWILLFEAYNHTTVSAATLCYYAAPVFVIFASPFLFGEKLGAKKLLCIPLSCFGMVLVSGIFEEKVSGINDLYGIFLALGAAALYASVVIINKSLSSVPPIEKTLVQLGSSCFLVLPYSLIAEDFSAVGFSAESVVLLIVVGVLHTGIAYLLYFGSIGNLPAQTTALFSYIDPVTAIVLSSLILDEKMTFYSIAGAILILGSAIFGEKTENKPSTGA